MTLFKTIETIQSSLERDTLLGCERMALEASLKFLRRSAGRLEAAQSEQRRKNFTEQDKIIDSIIRAKAIVESAFDTADKQQKEEL